MVVELDEIEESCEVREGLIGLSKRAEWVGPEAFLRGGCDLTG